MGFLGFVLMPRYWWFSNAFSVSFNELEFTRSYSKNLEDYLRRPLSMTSSFFEVLSIVNLLSCSSTTIGLWSEIFSLCGSHLMFSLSYITLLVNIMSMFVFCWFFAPFLVHVSDLYIIQFYLISSSCFSHVFVSIEQLVSMCNIIGYWYWS